MRKIGKLRLKPVWLLVTAAMALLFAVTGFAQPLRGRFQDNAFFQRQAFALQHEHSSDLRELRQAPRYIIRATVDYRTRTVTAQMAVEFTNRSADALKELVFYLYPNADSIYAGGSLEVVGVSQGNTPVEPVYEQDGTVMRVPLAVSLRMGQSALVEVSFKSHVPGASWDGYGIYNQARGVLALAGWYPVLAVYQGGWMTPEIPEVGDALMAETSLYEVELKTPAGYLLASTGTVIERSVKDSWITWKVVSGPAREFAAAISNKFQVLEKQSGGTLLRVYSLPASAPANSAQSGMDILEQAFRVFQTRFGPYPFNEFEMVEVPITIGGYEFSGMVFVDDGERTGGRRADYRYLVVHELAHQWWYGLVGNQTVDQPWLDEAHATYAAILYLEEAVSSDSARIQVNLWKNQALQGTTNRPPVGSSAREFSYWPDYRDAVYTRGALFIDQLRTEIGEEAFFKLLHQFQELHRYEIASTSDYFNQAERIAGKDLDWLMAEWFGVSEP